MISKKSDDAISPVIGVMLMLVVTVVIAAAVTIFATGVVGETEAAPVAVLDVEILSSVEALEGMKGPELFITHLSGEAVDTKDIELRFSWTDDTCGKSHYSTYSADGFEKEVGTGYAGRSQALYVKSTMKHDRTEYGSGNLNHYFGDVILTPGLKLTATSEFLSGYSNTGSPFMDYVFDNYNKNGAQASGSANPTLHSEYCYECMEAQGESEWCPFTGSHPFTYIHNGETRTPDINTHCSKCAGASQLHTIQECIEMNCYECYDSSAGLSGGIMTHLQKGTAVDVMIIHIPSGKAIYDNTVIVQ